MHIYDPSEWIVLRLSLLILISVAIQCLLAYWTADFSETSVQRKITMAHIKHEKHGSFYKNICLPNYVINFFFQNFYLDVWQDSEQTLWATLHITMLDISFMKAYICDKTTFSVSDVKCSNAVVSELMNEVMI